MLICYSAVSFKLLLLAVPKRSLSPVQHVFAILRKNMLKYCDTKNFTTMLSSYQGKKIYKKKVAKYLLIATLTGEPVSLPAVFLNIKWEP